MGYTCLNCFCLDCVHVSLSCSVKESLKKLFCQDPNSDLLKHQISSSFIEMYWLIFEISYWQMPNAISENIHNFRCCCYVLLVCVLKGLAINVGEIAASVLFSILFTGMFTCRSLTVSLFNLIRIIMIREDYVWSIVKHQHKSYLCESFIHMYSITMGLLPLYGLTDNHLTPSIFQLLLEITPLLCWQSSGSFIKQRSHLPIPYGHWNLSGKQSNHKHE